ncbi:MAG TPA: hypothetical protein VD995_02830 [Azospirillum sp.]|nr:hypothetical protein [Azospirillum sp.]
MTAARIAQSLFAAFGLPVPPHPPAPVAPERLPVFCRPANRRPMPFHPLRLAVGGAVTTNHKREGFFR